MMERRKRKKQRTKTMKKRVNLFLKFLLMTARYLQ
jgi:hypothetical protein